MTLASTQQDIHDHIDRNQDGYLQDLFRFLRIPSVSTLPDHKRDVDAAANYVAEELVEAGIGNARVVRTSGQPLVAGAWLAAPGKPTILIYGHFDVQPADPIDEWISPPFVPEIRDGNIYARGTVDDKGPLLAMIKAVNAIRAVRGTLPVNLRFLIEGEEESGGKSITSYLSKHAKEMACDAVLIADTMMLGPGLPAILYGLRGIMYAEIEVEAVGASDQQDSDVVQNPLYSLLTIIAGLKDADGLIHIPGLYELAQPVSDAERAEWAQYPIDVSDRMMQEMRLDSLPGEQNYMPVERLVARPTFDVHGIVSDEGRHSHETAGSAKAIAKVSLRIVPGQTPEKVFMLLQRRVAELAPEGMQVVTRFVHGANPALLDIHNPFMSAAQTSMSEEFGHEASFVRDGASIPVVSLLSEHLSAPVILMGYGLISDGLHAPNEHFGVDRFSHAIHGTVRFLEKVEDLAPVITG